MESNRTSTCTDHTYCDVSDGSTKELYAANILRSYVNPVFEKSYQNLQHTASNENSDEFNKKQKNTANNHEHEILGNELNARSRWSKVFLAVFVFLVGLAVGAGVSIGIYMTGSSYNQQPPVMPPKTPVCPVGFFYLEHVGRCYKLITDRLTWSDSSARCLNSSSTAHLAAITNEQEHFAILYHLQTLNYTVPEFGNCKWGRGIFYTSGQRINPNDCNTTFVWKLRDHGEKELTYSYWPYGEPNCAFGTEACLAYDTFGYSLNYRFNDIPCDWKQCSICEADPTA